MVAVRLALQLLATVLLVCGAPGDFRVCLIYLQGDLGSAPGDFCCGPLVFWRGLTPFQPH